jgi:nicotinamide-nucleotide amidase
MMVINPMRIEVINTGTELLLGNTINSHLAFFGQELFPLGLRIARQITVPDGEAIRDALRESLSRAEIVLVTGGLGPTTDDITREITAELLGLELTEDAVVLQAITDRFMRRGITMRERVKRQAQVPRGATVLPNHNGTAPGLHLRVEGQKQPRDPRDGPTFEFRPSAFDLFLLPGPPRELKPMFRESVMPILRTLAPAPAAHECRSYRVAGIGESDVEALVGEPILAIPKIELGYCARPGEVEIRCIGTPEMLAAAEQIILEKLPTQIVSRDNRTLEQVIVENLTSSGKKLALAESCTGGFIANRITNIPGASAVFVAGFVTYANEVKSAAVGVKPALIAEHGAVSREVAAAMSEGALHATDADFALSTTGIAGPGGGSDAKPVGTVFIALATREGETKVEHHKFSTDRETFKWLVSQAALDLLRRHLDSN